jgi:hypothetical protein
MLCAKMVVVGSLSSRGGGGFRADLGAKVYGAAVSVIATG